MAAITPADVAEAVASQVPAFFNDAFEQFRQGEGGYLVNGEPAGAVAKIGQAVGRAACRQWGANPSATPLPGSERFERACRPYLEGLDPANGVGVEAPFPGGQCSPVVYEVWAEEYNPVSGTFNPLGRQGGSLQTVVGPISALRIDIGPSCFTGFTNGRQLTITGRGGPDTGDRVIVPTRCVADAPGGALGLRNLTPVRQDGLPDNCGNPPPVVVQPKPQPDPIGSPFPFSPTGGPPFDVDVDIDPDGKIVFDIGTGPITVDPFPDSGGAGGVVGGDPTDPGSAGASSDTGVGGAASGEAPSGEELVGVLVSLLAVRGDPNTFNNNELTVYRGAGYVRMGYPGRLGVDITGGTLINPQFFHAQQRGLTAWTVNANLGFTIRVTPYYRSVE